MRPEQKLEERRYAERFLAAFPEVTGAELRDWERPDFLVELPDGRVGIEVRRLFWPHDGVGSPPQAQDVRRAQLIHRTCELYDRNGGAPARVWVHLSDGLLLRRDDIDALAWVLSDLVGERRVTEGEHVVWEWEQLPPSLRDRVDVVSAWGGHRKSSLWTANGAFMVPYLAPDEVQGELAAKEDKVAEYRSSCDRVWLLLVADTMEQASTLYLRDESRTHEYRSGFDRAFVLYTLEEEYVELAVTPVG